MSKKEDVGPRNLARVASGGQDIASAILETMDCLVVVLDQEGRVLQFNRACRDTSGYSLEDVRGKSVWDLPILPPEERALVRGFLARLLAGQPSQRFENHWLTKDGRRRLISWSHAALGARGGDALIINTGIDITEQRRVEDALRESEQRFRLALKSSPITMFTQDRALQYNWIYSPIHGVAVEGVLGKTDDEILSPKDASLLTGIKRRVLEDGAGTRQEVELSTGGIRIVYDVCVEPLRSAGGEITGITGTGVDITERKRMEEQLQARVRREAAIVAFGHRALTGANLSSLLDDAVATVITSLDVDHSSALELLPGGATLLLRASAGWPRDVVFGKQFPAGTGSPAGYAMLQGEPITFEDLRHETRFRVPGLLLERCLTSGAVVLIPGRERPFGTLNALSTARRTFTNDDVQFLQSIANLLAAAIERQSLEKEVLQISEDEQGRIGRDLHDSLCQHLSGISFLAHRLEQSLVAKSLPEASHAAEISKLLAEGAAQAREIARGLVPVDDSDSGLTDALRELARAVRKRAGVHCSLRAGKSVAVRDGFMAGHLFRIAQEAVANAVKHSRARHIWVALAAHDSGLVLTVRDDGIGLRNGHDTTNGMGLRTMRHRAALINAQLCVESPGLGGTVVTCCFEGPRALGAAPAFWCDGRDEVRSRPGG